MDKSSKRFKWILCIFIFIFLVTFIFYGVKSVMIRAYMKNFKQPPTTVSTVKAVLTTWHPFLSAAGTLKASNGVDINSEVSGQIVSIHFQSGSHVSTGDLLVQLNDAVDQQTLLRDQAALRFDKIDYHRKEILLKENAVAQSAVDAAKAAYLQADAAVQSDQVLIAQKKIRAPFSGKIGIRQVNIGQYITSGTSIVTLQEMHPLFVDFSLPEQDLPYLKNNQAVRIKVDAYPSQFFQGDISAINSAVDINTRTIAVRATVPNQNEALFPGLFANVDVILPDQDHVLTVPQSAVTYSLYGDSVYIVVPKGKDKTGQPTLIATQKYVAVGDRRGNVVAITKGIKVGDDVVTSGQLKLHPDAQVIVNNAVTLK